MVRWWKHTGSSWATGSGTEVGTGWHKFLFVGAGSNGGVYAISRDGTLNWYQDRAWQTGGGDWVGPYNVGDTWNGFACVTASNAGVLYTVSPDGSLSWYRNTVEAQKEWDVALGVGTGWGA